MSEDRMVIPDAVLKAATNERDEHYALIGLEEEANLAFAVAIARWMREECAKVAAKYHTHAGVWCGHNKCAVALIEAGIKLIGTNL